MIGGGNEHGVYGRNSAQKGTGDHGPKSGTW